MRRELTGKNFSFHPPKARSNSYRVLLWIVLILIGVWVYLQLERGQVKSPFAPTPTPTRLPTSYIREAEAYFAAGKLDDPMSDKDAIGAYQRAVQVDPNNAQVWAELARIQTYSSSLQSTDQQRLERLREALASIDRAVELAPDDSTMHAMRAFVLDWNASSNLITSDERERLLFEAEGEANRAYLLDPNNALALAFYAEVLLDQQKWDQAREYAEQALAIAPNSMDAHRVYATVLEALSAYRDSIQEYQRAAELTPNLTFLYLRIGLGYRHLQVYNTALEYFEMAARINEQLGVRDPLPYIAIAKTYAQQGEFFIASRNAEKALLFDPTSANTFGQLGMIYVQARNYEAALPALRCAVEGCSPEQNTTLQELAEKFGDSDENARRLRDEGVNFSVPPLALTNLDIAYYYVRYGSVLAYLSSAENGYCEKSLQLMATLRATYPNDPLLMQNVEDNEATCNSLLSSYSP